MRGRPSSFTQEIADEICARLGSGEPLAQICRDDHMPGVQTVYDWREVRGSFSVAFARARDLGFDQIALDALKIADDGSNDTYVVNDDEGNPITKTDFDHIQRSKLRVETRLKLLAKWDPKRYGDRQEVRLTDADGKSFAIMLPAKVASDESWQSQNS